LEPKLETAFIGRASDLSFDDLIVDSSLAVDPMLHPLLVAAISASPLILLALLACLVLT
jgi:hypothetical protein